MAGLIWADTPYGLLVFAMLTVLGGLAAIASGRALATVWDPIWLTIPIAALLAAGVRFLHFALFQEQLLSLHYYLVAATILFLAAVAAYAWKRAGQMAQQYPWTRQKNNA
jgi:hypothetical protein